MLLPNASKEQTKRFHRGYIGGSRVSAGRPSLYEIVPRNFSSEFHLVTAKVSPLESFAVYSIFQGFRVFRALKEDVFLRLSRFLFAVSTMANYQCFCFTQENFYQVLRLKDIHVQLQNSLISRISSVTTGYVHHRLGCCYHHTALTSHYDYISVDCDEANQIKYTFSN